MGVERQHEEQIEQERRERGDRESGGGGAMLFQSAPPLCEAAPAA
jgi:hypothetical protein